MRCRVPLSVPSWNGASYRAILRSLLFGKVIDGRDANELRSLIVKTLRVEDAVVCGSGSLAIELALRACRVGPGDEVVIPTFCCTSVVPPILAVGAAPVLADVGEELNVTAETVERMLTDKTSAIVVPHLFGNPAEIGAIVDLARSRGIRVIDDAAQALGATIDGRPVGSFGDAGILSFGSEKVCFGLGGGIALSRKKIFSGQAEAELESPEVFRTLRTLFSTLVWRRWRRFTLPLRNLLVCHAGPETPPVRYRREGMANLNAAVALSLVEALDANIAARRARVAAYQRLLQSDERLELIPHRTGSACLAQVVRIVPNRSGDDSAARLVEMLGNAGYEIQGSYIPIHLLAGYEQFARRRLAHAERVWPDLIELPCEPNVGLEDVERIASSIKRVLSS